MSESTHAETACMNLQVLRVSHYVLKCFDEAYREHGVRATQIPVLMQLRGRAEATVREVATALESERSVMFRKLRILAERGWVQELPRDTGRERRYSLTDDGEALLARTEPARAAVQERLFGRLTEAEQGLLLSLCARLQGSEEADPVSLSEQE
ncbi:MAG: MarR family winged helix-turn-helix transcriptional regulator [Pseudomonadota bacterium]